MYKEYKSHNTALTNSLRQSFVPSWGQAVIYLLFGFVLLTLLNAGALWTFFNNNVGVSKETANSVIQSRFNRFQ